MAYRSDLDAAAARIVVLEREKRELEEQVDLWRASSVEPMAPSRWHHLTASGLLVFGILVFGPFATGVIAGFALAARVFTGN